MAGQSGWSNAGTATNAYVIRARLGKEIYYSSTWATVLGTVNHLREVKTITLPHGDRSVDVGNSSVVWEKTYIKGTGGNETRFTMRERNKGMASYGEVEPKAGDFAKWKHTRVFINEVKSPKYPIIGSESQEKVAELVNDVVKMEKDNINLWRSQEVDLDFFRTMLTGASRGLLLTTDGGMGMTLYGGTAGAQRSCYNAYFCNEGDQTALATPSASSVATQEQTYHDKLATLHDDDACGFDFDEHLKLSNWVSVLGFQPVTIGKTQYRAVNFCDPRNVERLTAAGGTLAGLFQYAWKRGEDNPALYRMKALVLDDILYIPCQQLAFFRPSVNSGGTGITYGCGHTQDPRADAFTNASNITLSIVCSAGAMLRSMEKRVWFTEDVAAHTGAMDIAVHYRDGMIRREYGAEDGRTALTNDSSLVMFHYDPGVGVAFAS